MKIMLGSAQFGLPYGIANSVGQVQPNKVSEILNVASINNIGILDTAIVYGTSEEALGMAGIDSFNVVTKLPSVPQDISDISGWIKEEVKGSLEKLKKDSVYGLLLHNHESLFQNNSHVIVKELENLKSSGVVSKIGVSIYDPFDLERISSLMDLDIVQAPLNIVDQRFVTSGWLERLKSLGVEIHTRSTFLQGLLLLEPSKIPKSFEKWSDLWTFWNQELVEKDLNAIQECLNFVLSISDVDRVVVGVETAEQLQDIIEIAKEKKSPNNWDFMKCEDEDLINPSKWNIK